MTLEELKKQRALNLANNKKQTSSSLNEFDENRGVLAQALSNVDESGIQLLKDITTPIFHPIQTAKDLKNLGSSIINLIRPGEQGNEQLAKEVGNFFKERYGGLENIKKTFATDPLGMLSDISIIFSGGSMLPSKVGKISKLASKVDPIYAAVQGTKKLAQGGEYLAGKTIAPIVGMTTGTGGKALTEAYQAGKVGGDQLEAFTKSMRGVEEPSAIVEDVNKAFQKLKEEKAITYTTNKKALKLHQKKIDMGKIADDVLDYEISKSAGKTQTTLSDAAQKTLEKIKKHITEWVKDDSLHNARGADQLKRKIDAEYPSGLKPPADQAALVAEIRNMVKDQIIRQVPEYGDVMKAYEQAVKLEKELIENLAVGSKKNASTTLKKLQSVIRNNVHTNFGQRLKSLNKLEKVDDYYLLPRIAGQSLTDLMPSGIQKLMGTGTIGYAAGTVNPAILGLLPFQSPRLTGEAAKAFGQTVRTADKIPLTKTLQASRATGLLDRPIQENRGLLQ